MKISQELTFTLLAVAAVDAWVIPSNDAGSSQVAQRVAPARRQLIGGLLGGINDIMFGTGEKPADAVQAAAVSASASSSGTASASSSGAAGASGATTTSRAAATSGAKTTTTAATSAKTSGAVTPMIITMMAGPIPAGATTTSGASQAAATAQAASAQTSQAQAVSTTTKTETAQPTQTQAAKAPLFSLGLGLTIGESGNQPGRVEGEPAGDETPAEAAEAQSTERVAGTSTNVKTIKESEEFSEESRLS